jgi:hypothetical protein
MDELDRDALVERWTRHHGLRIPYRKWWGGQGRYEPDFLVELADGAKELREVKGEHLFADRNTMLKLKAGEVFCRARSMKFRVVTKSSVDPAIWSPDANVVVREVRNEERPKLAEDAYIVPQPTTNWGCLVAAALFTLLMLALLVLLGVRT